MQASFPLRVDRRVLGAFAIAAVLHLIGTIFLPGYSSGFAVRSMLVLASFLALASIGQTIVIILGGIDLSIPFIIGFANVAAAQLTGQGMPFLAVLLLVLGTATAIGALNGFVSARLSVHPLIITLGVGTVVQGLVLLWTGGFPTGSAPAFVSRFVSLGGSTGPLPVPPFVPVFALVAIAVIITMSRTVFGRRLYALGANPGAAPLALIRPVAMWSAAFAISAFFAALTGVLLLGFTGSAYGAVGQPYLFETIAAVVIGGTALVGGRGSYLGTIGGALALREIHTLLIGFGLPQASIQAAFGLVIILLFLFYGRDAPVSSTI